MPRLLPALFAAAVAAVGAANPGTEGEAAGEAWAQYRAAAVSLSPHMVVEARSRVDADAVKAENAKLFFDFATRAARSGAQIVVFPEYGLFGPVLRTRNDTALYAEVVPEIGACVDATLHSTALQTLRKAANASGAVLVFHLAEAAGQRLYSTQVALSPRGCVLGKYHKFHLYGEPYFDRPAHPEVVTFDSPFGVRFGMFVCFDIMFGDPANVARARGVTDFVFSSWWVNFPPLLLASQVQSGWAAARGANLVAANTAEPGWHGAGSGIYAFAPPPGDARRVQRDSFRNATLPAGKGSVLVETVSSPPRRPLPPPGVALVAAPAADAPMTVALTALTGGPRPVRASANGTECVADVDPAAVPAAGAAGPTWALLAASGRYHGLFWLEVCAIVPCRSMDRSCLDGLGAAAPGLALRGPTTVSATFTRQNATMAFATRPSGLLVADAELERPNATAVSLNPSSRPLYALAVVNQAYQ